MYFSVSKFPIQCFIVLLVIVVSIGGISSNKSVDQELERTSRNKRLVFFPQYTILQITMAVVIPIEVPKRKSGMNLAVQVNYNLPYTLKEFWKPPFWQTTWNSRSLSSNSTTTRSERSVDTSGSIINHLNDDNSADDHFYSLLNSFFMMEGYEEDCLEKAVCEMSQHPMEYEHDDVLSEIMHFIFSPSKHSHSVVNATSLKDRLHTAENHGTTRADCDGLYKCIRSPLEEFTVLKDDYETINLK